MARRMTAESPTYDLTLLLDPEIEEARREKIVSDVEALIDQHAEMVGRHDWGTRKTAFDVRKRSDVDYRLIQFRATTPLLESLNHALKITDGVLRFRIVKLRRGTPAPPDLRASAAVPAGTDDERD
jgi:small subunit ribosomal protein S6